METKLLFIQFLHPGGEHKSDPGRKDIKSWNTGDHKRKFMVNGGRYFSGGQIVEESLSFWGEWEPQSTVTRIENPIRDGGPRYAHRPYYILPESLRNLQNTDPFVFGSQFHYTWCKQLTKKGPTQLRYLDRGSVILFGSCVRERFALDTVFVVDSWIDYTLPNHNHALDDRISQTYEEVTICRIGGCHSNRLYFGATFDNPVEGMFSFFPCCPHKEMPQGFVRPTISLPCVVSDRNKRGRKYTYGTTAEFKIHWKSVVDQVERQNLSLGVYTELPPKHK